MYKRQLATYMIPQISTSVGVNDVVPLVKDIKKYHIGDTAGFPFSRQTKRVGRMDCVIPTTLESNVVLLHQFLYGEDASYRPVSYTHLPVGMGILIGHTAVGCPARMPDAAV